MFSRESRIFVKVHHSNFVEMHEDASDFYPSTLVFYTRHQVNITIYRTVYLYIDMCQRKLISKFRFAESELQSTFPIA
jgi:hypothetical protein